MTEPLIVLPRDYANRIEKCGKSFGFIDVRQDRREQVFVVDGFWKGNEGGMRNASEWVKNRHYLGHAQLETRMGLWYRVDNAIHEFGRITAVRRGGFKLDTFRDSVDAGWVSPGTRQTLAITYAERPDGDREWAGWILDGAQQIAQRIDLEVVGEDVPIMAPLVDHWPLLELATEQVIVIGAGSIGSAANDALVAYGVRQLALVDPDRLHAHNFARHRSHPGQLGRRKVTSEKQRLIERDPTLEIDAFTADVIDDADLMRTLFADASLIVVTSDGVDSRRAANHLARRAGKPAVFSCVLMDGSYGEVLRTPTPAVGCLLCARDELIKSGAMINPEEHLDREYGTGTRHLPMTAVGGDLGLVGQFAAKTAVATILQAKGHADQRLPGDHAVIGLRPRPGMAEPFNIEFAGEIQWRTLPPPRPHCPTCSTSV